MTYNNKAKLKTLYVRQILEEETDAERGLSMRQIIERLEQHEIKAERKSVYRDIEVLREFGCDICSYQRNPVEYALIRRQFKLPELMLMVDAVQSNKALTVRQSTALETNIKLLASDHDRALMERKIHVPGRIKTNADSVFGNVDVIHGAMRLKRKVEFAYHRRNIEGERREARGGRPHALTPVEVNHADGFYYMAAWDDGHSNMVEYRLHRMGKASVSDSRATRNAEIDHHAYDEDRLEYFGRFGGEEIATRLDVRADKVEIVLDRFGDGAEISKTDDETAKTFVKVRKSEQFFGWIAGMENTVKIAGPDNLVREYISYLQELLSEPEALNAYQNDTRRSKDEARNRNQTSEPSARR